MEPAPSLDSTVIRIKLSYFIIYLYSGLDQINLLSALQTA